MNTPVPKFFLLEGDPPPFTYKRGRFIRVTISSGFVGMNEKDFHTLEGRETIESLNNFLPDGYENHFKSEYEKLCGWRYEDTWPLRWVWTFHDHVTKEYLPYLFEKYISRKRWPFLFKTLTNLEELTDGTELWPELEVYEQSFMAVLETDIRQGFVLGRNKGLFNFNRGGTSKFENEGFLQNREEKKDSLCKGIEELKQLPLKKDIDNLNSGEYLNQLLSLYKKMKGMDYFMTPEEAQEIHHLFASLIPEEATVKFLRIKKDATN